MWVLMRDVGNCREVSERSVNPLVVGSSPTPGAVGPKWGKGFGRDGEDSCLGSGRAQDAFRIRVPELDICATARRAVCCFGS